MVAPFAPAEPALPRLTTAQYRNVIRDLFGPDLTIPELEPDQRPYSFSIIGASTTTISEHGVDLYSQAAFKLAHAVFADTTRRADTSRVAALPPAPSLPSNVRGAPPPPKPRRPAPDVGVVLHLSPTTPLTPGRYAV